MSDILIVDDERDIRELIADILEDEGYGTRLAGNSDDAMSAIADSRPALLILDIWLKDSNMDGIDILKAVKRDYPEVPVVIISGHGNIEIAVAAIKRGAYDYHRKTVQDRPADPCDHACPRGQPPASREVDRTASGRATAPAEVRLIGSSARPSETAQVCQIEKVDGESNSRVLINGPLGLRQGNGRAGAISMAMVQACRGAVCGGWLCLN